MIIIRLVVGIQLEDRWEKLSGKSIPQLEIITDIDNDIGKQWKDEFLENFGACGAMIIPNWTSDIYLYHEKMNQRCIDLYII